MDEFRKKRNLTVQYDAMHVLYAISCCCISTYATVFLQNRGYSNAVLGLIIAAGDVIGLVVGPIMASIIDKSKRITVYHCYGAVIALGAAMEVLLMVLPGKSFAVSAVFALLIATLVVAGPLTTEIRFRVDRFGRYINFGAALGIRSLFFVPATYILGRVCNECSPEILPALGLITAVVQVASLTVLARTVRRNNWEERHSTEAERECGSSMAEFIRSNKRHCLFCAGVALLFFSQSVTGSFLINIVRSLGGDTADMGAVSALLAFAEIPFMVLYTRITKNIHCSRVLIFSAVMFVVKAAWYMLAPNLPLFYCTAIFHGLSYALISPALVDYTAIVVSYKDSAKAQTLTGSAGTVGGILSYSLGGVLFDTLEVRQVLLVGVLIGVVGAAVTVLSVDRKKA